MRRSGVGRVDAAEAQDQISVAAAPEATRAPRNRRAGEAGDDQVRVVQRGAVGVGERVAELAALVEMRSWPRVTMIRDRWA